MDGVTVCNREPGHSYEHMLLVYRDNRKGSPAAHTWAEDGTETCTHCGHTIEPSTGMCARAVASGDD